MNHWRRCTCAIIHGIQANTGAGVPRWSKDTGLFEFVGARWLADLIRRLVWTMSNWILRRLHDSCSSVLAWRSISNSLIDFSYISSIYLVDFGLQKNSAILIDCAYSTDESAKNIDKDDLVKQPSNPGRSVDFFRDTNRFEFYVRSCR